MRIAFTLYAAMRKGDWKNISPDNIKFSVNDIRDRLIPVLKQDQIPGTSSSVIHHWAEQLTNQCRAAFKNILPFNQQEIVFLQKIQHGIIDPQSICQDAILNEKIKTHPLLKWRALNSTKK